MVRIAEYASLLGLVALASAAPNPSFWRSNKPTYVPKPAPSPSPTPSPAPAPAAPAASPAAQNCSPSSALCHNPPAGLDVCSCNYLASIGMQTLGSNPTGSNGAAWVGSDGPNLHHLTNSASTAIVVVVWTQAAGYSSSFVKTVGPAITYALQPGQTVVISMANGVSGAMAPVHVGSTTFTADGQLGETWLEYTTGGTYATYDVSREVNMGGHAISANVGDKCTTDMTTCVFTCVAGNTCGAAGTYQLENCSNGSQPGSTYGLFAGQPSGGCQGGGNVVVTFGN